MTTPHEIEEKFWKALKADRTVMLGLSGVEDGRTRPMTAMLDGDRGPLWFFTAKDTAIVQNLIGGSRPGILTFTSKSHDLFANVSGRLKRDDDRAVIERLWNPFIAAWYEGGKTDPKLALLRYDAEDAEIWLNGSSIAAGVKMLLGMDPKADYKDKVAKVTLDDKAA